MESTCGKLHKRWLFAPGEEKQLRKHVPVKVAKKKRDNEMQIVHQAGASSPKKTWHLHFFRFQVLYFLRFFLHFNTGAGADHSRQQARLSPEAHLSP